MQSFRHKCSFLHNSNHASNQNTSFTKVVQFGSVIDEMVSEVYDMQSFGHTSSFRHNPYYASNQKTSFTKVIQFGSVIQELG
jgi:hypothetical protein